MTTSIPPALQTIAPRAVPPALRSYGRSSWSVPGIAFPREHTQAVLRESFPSDLDTRTPAPLVRRLPPIPPLDVFSSAIKLPPRLLIPQSPPVSSSPCRLPAKIANPSRILNQRIH